MEKKDYEIYIRALKLEFDHKAVEYHVKSDKIKDIVGKGLTKEEAIGDFIAIVNEIRRNDNNNEIVALHDTLFIEEYFKVGKNENKLSEQDEMFIEKYFSINAV